MLHVSELGCENRNELALAHAEMKVIRWI